MQGATVDSYVDDCLIYTPLVQGAGLTLNCQTWDGKTWRPIEWKSLKC